MSSDAKHFILCFGKRNVCANVRLRYFVIIYARLMSIRWWAGQLYDVHNKIKISKKHWLGLHIYKDTWYLKKFIWCLFKTLHLLTDAKPMLDHLYHAISCRPCQCLYHGQTLANRTKPGPSFQLWYGRASTQMSPCTSS